MRFDAKIAERLKRLSPRRLNGNFSGEAGVLIAIIERNGSPLFLLTRRTENVATHKGQISFPGGMREAGDISLERTALREAYEEIGAAPDEVDILGEFHDYVAVTDHLVRTYAGVLHSRALAPRTSEVAYLLEVPFKFFRDSKPVVRQRLVKGQARNVYYFDFEGETIWGLTASIIKEFLEYVDADPANR